MKCGVAESLAKAAPNGVDCYFDNVGGDMSAAVMAETSKFRRLSLRALRKCQRRLWDFLKGLILASGKMIAKA